MDKFRGHDYEHLLDAIRVFSTAQGLSGYSACSRSLKDAMGDVHHTSCLVPPRSPCVQVRATATSDFQVLATVSSDLSALVLLASPQLPLSLWASRLRFACVYKL